jgi:heme A synthase
MSLYRSRRPSSAPRVVMLALVGIVLGLGAAAVFFGLPRVVAVSPEGSASSRNPITSPSASRWTRPRSRAG